MSAALELFWLSCSGLGLKQASMAVSPSFSLRFEPLLKPRRCRASTMAKTKSVAVPFVSLDCRTFWRPSLVAFAASHEESKHLEIEVGKEDDDLKLRAEESEEAWKQILVSFKEQSLKMLCVSLELYKLYFRKARVILKETSKQLKITAKKATHDLSVIATEISEEGKKYLSTAEEKAMVILKETSEQLKIQAKKATHDLGVIAKEISEDGKKCLSTAAENFPEPVKEIVETFVSSTDDLDDISKVHDFCVGIPYGFLLSLGGFLSFMLVGSISAIRFGVILGGALLALSISSLKSYNRGESFPLALKGQAAIAGILFLREIHLLFQRPSFLSLLTTSISGAVVAFYMYGIMLDRERQGGSTSKHRTDN